MDWRKQTNKILRWIRNILLLLFVGSLFLVILYKYLPVYYTCRMFAKNTEQLFHGEKVRIRHQWVPLSGISQNLVQSAIASEDLFFLIHNGFDWGQSDIKPGEISRSRYKWKTGTISQQTARNVFLLPGKTRLNQWMEAYFTVLIEFVWGKERILEVYLNSVEFGNGIFGAEAIAQKNYQLSAGELPIPEAALITVAINNPDELDSSAPTTYMLRRQAKIISIMDQMIPMELGKQTHTNPTNDDPD
jgi:monofunctional biosynthetic peptidoglycan transglycosylase